MSPFILLLNLLAIGFAICNYENCSTVNEVVAENENDVLDHEKDSENPVISQMALVPYNHPKYYQVDSKYTWGQAWIRKKNDANFRRFRELSNYYHVAGITYNLLRFEKKWFGIGNLTGQERRDLWTFIKDHSPLPSELPSTKELEKYLNEVFTFKRQWKGLTLIDNATYLTSIMNAFKKMDLGKLRDTEHPTFADLEETLHIRRASYDDDLTMFQKETLSSRLLLMIAYSYLEVINPNYRRIYPSFKETVDFMKKRHIYKGWYSLQNLTGYARKQLMISEAHRPIYVPQYEKTSCKATGVHKYPSHQEFKKHVLDVFYADQLSHDPIGIRNIPIVCPGYRRTLMDFVTSARDTADTLSDDNAFDTAVMDLRNVTFPVLDKLFESSLWVVYEIPLRKAKRFGLICDSNKSCRTFSKQNP